MRSSLAPLMLMVVVVGCGRQGSTKTLFTPTKTDDGVYGALISRSEGNIDAGDLVPGEPGRIKFVPWDTEDEPMELDLRPVSPQSLGLTAESLGLEKGPYAWFAQLPDGNQAFVMRIGELTEAQIPIGDKIYRVRSKTVDTGIQEVFDTTRFRDHPLEAAPTEGGPILGPAPDGPVEPDLTEDPEKESVDPPCEDSADRIDVMVLYTPAACAAAAGVTPDETPASCDDPTQIEKQIAVAIGLANQAYENSTAENSKASHHLNLVYTGEAPELAENTNLEPDPLTSALRKNLANTKDEKLSWIHDERDSNRADLVSLVYEYKEKDGENDVICGAALGLGHTAGLETKEKGFSVVRRWCSDVHKSFAHEIGHNLGAYHERVGEKSTYNYGHIQPEPNDGSVTKWRTVMSTRLNCSGCARVLWFSNPDVEYPSEGEFLRDKTGAADEEDNVRVFEENAGEVSHYLCSYSGDASNVWMKDFWDDEGAEPNAATEGEPMWQSPYLWVRQSNDGLERQHIHQSPAPGKKNYVYVKLQNNGGEEEAGFLGVYYAKDYGTNPNAPTEWTPLGSEERTIEKGSVEVVEFEWSDVPESGDYGLLARWQTDEATLTFTDLVTDVRASNDLIWRSTTPPIELSGEEPEAVEFELAGDAQSLDSYVLISTTPLSAREIDWAKLVTAEIKVEPKFVENLKVFEGLDPRGKGAFEFQLGEKAKLIGPFALAPNQRARIRLTVKAKPAAVKKASAELGDGADYEITFMQLRRDERNPSKLFDEKGLVIGGVSYTLRIPARK